MNILPHDASTRVESSKGTAPTAGNQESGSALDSKPSAVSNDDVAISSQFQQLEQGAEQLAELPEVDLDRVAAISSALADGSLDIDLDQIAAGIADQHGSR